MISEFFSEDVENDRVTLFSRLFYDNNVDKIVYCIKVFRKRPNNVKPLLHNIRWDLINNSQYCEKRKNKWFGSHGEISNELWIKNLNIFERKLKLEKLLEK